MSQICWSIMVLGGAPSFSEHCVHAFLPAICLVLASKQVLFYSEEMALSGKKHLPPNPCADFEDPDFIHILCAGVWLVLGSGYVCITNHHGDPVNILRDEAMETGRPAPLMIFLGHLGCFAHPPPRLALWLSECVLRFAQESLLVF